MPKTTLKQIPAAALYFDALAEIGDNGESAKTAPVTILARSGKPITHWYWGSIVHDLAGMKVGRERIALDFVHDPEQVIGYANRFDTSSGDLILGGALTPFQEKDRAAEILHKAKLGVPWEASIYFGEDAIFEELAEGQIATVNGNQVHGPAVVVRSWSLRGCAICPYGADPNTSSQFKRDGDATVSVTMLSADAETPAAGTDAETTEETPPAGEASDGVAAETEEQTEETTTETETKPEDAEGGASVEGSAQQEAEGAGDPNQQSVDARAELRRYLTAFGDNGAQWFADGVSFADAQSKYIDELKAQATALSTENQQLKTRLSGTRGEPGPLGFTPEGGASQQRAAELTSKFGDSGLVRIAAAIAGQHKG